jgi:hypothetical protein
VRETNLEVLDDNPLFLVIGQTSNSVVANPLSTLANNKTAKILRKRAILFQANSKLTKHNTYKLLRC